MGFLDKIKKFFDTGGVDTDLSAPEAFRWSDDEIPLRVRLTGHETEVRQISDIDLKLEEEVSAGADEKERRNRDRYTFVYHAGVTLQPGETVELDIAFPLRRRGFSNDSTAARAGRLIGAATELMGSGLTIGSTGSRYRISVMPAVEGARMRKATSRQIRALGFGDFSF